MANAEGGPIKSDHVKAVEYLMTDPDHCGGFWPQDLTAAIVDLLTAAEEEAEQLSSLSDGDVEGARDRLVQEMQKAETDGGARCMTNPGAGRYSNRRSIGSASDASAGSVGDRRCAALIDVWRDRSRLSAKAVGNCTNGPLPMCFLGPRNKPRIFH
ncbi:UNVERIFIED_ORG: hypothetical protein GGD59_003179 [Rhizobium esperanzae]